MDRCPTDVMDTCPTLLLGCAGDQSGQRRVGLDLGVGRTQSRGTGPLGSRVPAGRPSDRPGRHAPPDRRLRARGACGTSPSRSGWEPAPSTPDACNGPSASKATRSRPSSRECRSTSGRRPSSWTSATGHRPRQWRVLARPLRGPHGCRTTGPRLRHGHVPRHRGPHLRGHRHRHQPTCTGASRPPSTTGAGRIARQLPLDRLHRRRPIRICPCRQRPRPWLSPGPPTST